MSESLRVFLHQPGLRIETHHRVVTNLDGWPYGWPFRCLVCNQPFLKEDRHDEATVQVLTSDRELIGVLCEACAEKGVQR